MKTITLTEEQFIKAADEALSTFSKDEPDFSFALVLAYRLLMDKLFYDFDEVDLNE